MTGTRFPSTGKVALVEMRVGWQITAAISFSAALFSACGGADDAGSPATTETTPGPPPQAPTYAGLGAYERRCNAINREGAVAEVIYEQSKEMTLGDSDTITAAVTLDQSAPPEKVLPGKDVAGESGVVVSCQLQARLDASEDEFEIDETGWIDRSLFEVDTARWVWNLTPNLGGDHTLTLFVRPIVSFQGGSEEAEATQANVRDYTTSVHVNVPWNKRPEEFMTQVASTLNVAEGLIKTLTALLVALGALYAVLRGLRRRREKTH